MSAPEVGIPELPDEAPASSSGIQGGGVGVGVGAGLSPPLLQAIKPIHKTKIKQ